MKILYFTATGNSLYIAKNLADTTGGEILSVPRLVKEGTYEFTDEKIGIVFPLHGWGVPSFLVDFLKKATFHCDYLFAVVTYGIYGGAAAKHLTDIGREAGYSFSYINKIVMVDNYLPTFDMKKEIEKEPKKGIEKKLAVISSDITASRQWIVRENLVQKGTFNLMSRRKKPFNKKTLKVHVYGEGIENYLEQNDFCTGCGICASVCPVGNITVHREQKKISLSDKCFMCFACLHHCPSHALHIRGEVNGNRFRNSHISLNEIVKANNQA